MAEATSLVPIGRSDTGKAVVLSQNIAESPMAMFKHQQRFKAAQEAAEAKAKAAKEKQLADERKDIAFSPEKTDALYQASYNEAFQNLQNKSIELQKKYHSRGEQIPLEERLNLDKMAADVKQMKNFGDANAAWLKGAADEVLKNDDYDEAKTKQFIADYVLGPDNKPKFNDPLTLRNVTSEMMENHTLINTGKMTNRFVKQLNSQFTEKFYTEGKFDYKRAVEANAPIEYLPDGVTPARDKSGNVILKVTDQLVHEAKKDEVMNRYLTGMAKEQQAALERGEIEELPDIKENLKNLLESEVYAKQVGTRSRIPVRAPRVGADKPQPISGTLVGTARRSVTGADENGNVLTKNVVIPVKQEVADKNGNSYNINLAPSTFYKVNNETGRVEKVPNNGAVMKATISGLEYALTNPKNGHVIFPNEENPDNLESWMAKFAQNPKYSDYVLEPFVIGAVADKANVKMDYNEARKLVEAELEAGGKNSDEFDESDLKQMVEDRMNKGENIRQTNYQNMFPYKGENKLAADTQTKGTIKPNKETLAAVNRFNAILEENRKKAVSTKKSNDVLGFGGNKPAATTKKTQGKNNPLGF